MPNPTTPIVGSPAGPTLELPLTQIRIDGDTQSRVNIDSDVTAEYAERMKAGDTFPPVDVFFDGNENWLADGFHRYHAASARGAKSLACKVRKGNVRDARVFAWAANWHHGLRRTNADKRKCVNSALADEKFAKFSDRRLADMCGVGEHLVAGVRKESTAGNAQLNGDQKRVGRDGKTRKGASRKKASGKKIDAEPATQASETARPGAHNIQEPVAGGFESHEAKPHLDELGTALDTARRACHEAQRSLDGGHYIGTVWRHLDSTCTAFERTLQSLANDTNQVKTCNTGD